MMPERYQTRSPRVDSGSASDSLDGGRPIDVHGVGLERPKALSSLCVENLWGHFFESRVLIVDEEVDRIPVSEHVGVVVDGDAQGGASYRRETDRLSRTARRSGVPARRPRSGDLGFESTSTTELARGVIVRSPEALQRSGRNLVRLPHVAMPPNELELSGRARWPTRSKLSDRCQRGSSPRLRRAENGSAQASLRAARIERRVLRGTSGSCPPWAFLRNKAPYI